MTKYGEIYEDEYFRGFGPGEYAEMKAYQKELEDKTIWHTNVSELSVQVSPTPLDACELIAKGSTIPYEVYDDTYCNSGMMLTYDGMQDCLRSSAIPSVYKKVGIEIHQKYSTDTIAKVLSILMEERKKSSQIIIRAEKVSAVLSEQYQYMPITELLDICDDLKATFGEANFVSGCVSHNMSTAEFEYPEAAPRITAAYNKVLTGAGRSGIQQLIPVVQLRSSDTSHGAARLITYLKLDAHHKIPVGESGVIHTPPMEFDAQQNRITCMEKFRKEISLLFSKLEYNIDELLPKMLNTHIRHPGNTFIGLCKYAQIPQKWGGQIEEDIRADWPDGSDCTFLDLYEELTRATALAIEDGFSPYSKRVLDLEESITKVARNSESWRKYDLPGTVAWGTAKKINE